MILLDEPSRGIAPQIVAEIFGIGKNLNSKENVSFLLAEQNTTVALRRLRRPPEKRTRRDRGPGPGSGQQRGCQEILPRRLGRRPQKFPRHEILPPPQALAGLPSGHLPQHARALPRASLSGVAPGITPPLKQNQPHSTVWTRAPETRKRNLMARLPQWIAQAMQAPGWSSILAGPAWPGLRAAPRWPRCP